MNVYYLGPEGSYSNFIARKTFSDPIHDLRAVTTFRDVFDRVLHEESAIGVVPVENSTTSNVHENIDLLFHGHVNVIGEGFLSIALHLIGLRGASVDQLKEIYSHPVALTQCSHFISGLGATPRETSSTSEAARVVRNMQDPTIAAIGSEVLAQEQSLELLEPNIGNNEKNFTRFLFISQSPESVLVGEKTRVTVTFLVKHAPGALVTVLSALSDSGANLTKIESRPIPGRDWEYRFWIDLETEEKCLQELIDSIEHNTLEYRVLGVYPKGALYHT